MENYSPCAGRTHLSSSLKISIKPFLYSLGYKGGFASRVSYTILASTSLANGLALTSGLHYGKNRLQELELSLGFQLEQHQGAAVSGMQLGIPEGHRKIQTPSIQNYNRGSQADTQNSEV